MCGVCGGPRIEGNLGGETAVDALKEQQKHLGEARMRSIATVLQGMFVMAVGFAMVVVRPEAFLAQAIFFALAAVPLALAVRNRSRAGKARGLAKEANDRAMQAAAEDAARGGATAKQVAKRLRIAPDAAEKLLNTSAVHDRVRIDVHDESAEVVYRSDDGDDEAARADERRR